MRNRQEDAARPHLADEDMVVRKRMIKAVDDYGAKYGKSPAFVVASMSSVIKLLREINSFTKAEAKSHVAKLARKKTRMMFAKIPIIISPSVKDDVMAVGSWPLPKEEAV